jgi:hypothetical protein
MAKNGCGDKFFDRNQRISTKFDARDEQKVIRCAAMKE